MKPIPLDSSDFPSIRDRGQIYVDKTAYLHKLITDPDSRLFFISRPRRFGKSLMISTLKAIFQGKKELFEGLAISGTAYDWSVHPVIHLNMGLCSAGDVTTFRELLPVAMKYALKDTGYVYDDSLNPIGNFSTAIQTFHDQGTDPVILIDEYDDPVAQTIANPAEAEQVRTILAPLYRQLKEFVGSIRFLMITGVSKFTKMSIFSALSNLVDISFDDAYATMLGYTEEELDANFLEHISAHASKMKLSVEEYRQELRRMYNGYRFWTIEGQSVYNPVSINWTLGKSKSWFETHWGDTGRPSMLMNYLKREEVLALDPEKVIGVRLSDFDVADLANISVSGLLFQAGYLTIQDFNPYSQTYTLGIPDEEVREDFAVVMASLCAKQPVHWASSLGACLLTYQWGKFFEGLKSLYAGVAYGPTEKRVCEYSYGRCLAFLLQGQGIFCQPEVVQADGRSDMVCVHPCGVFVFELKVDQPAAIAMEQIQKKQYALPYAADSRPIWIVGLAFDSKTRHLIDCAYEQYQ